MILTYVDLPGSTTYGMVVQKSDGFVWQTTTSTFVDFVAANWANYDVAGAPKDTGSPVYEWTFPPGITTAGGYDVVFFRQLGGAPAITDPVIWVKEDLWTNGSAAIAPPAPSPSPEQVTGYLYTYDEEGVIEAAVQVRCQVKEMTAITDEDAALLFGYALDSTVRVETSDGAGLVQFPGLFKGVTYTFWRGTASSGGRNFDITIPADAADPYKLPSIIGMP